MKRILKVVFLLLAAALVSSCLETIGLVKYTADSAKYGHAQVGDWVSVFDPMRGRHVSTWPDPVTGEEMPIIVIEITKKGYYKLSYYPISEVDPLAYKMLVVKTKAELEEESVGE